MSARDWLFRIEDIVGAITTMRNVLIHEYFGVDVEVIWKTITEDLPILKIQLDAVSWGE